MVKKETAISIRFDAPLRAWLERKAAEQDRALASLVRLICRDYAEANGYAGPVRDDDNED